jgi:septal ring factor EnvC (AmiA/AmiB activator)
MKEDSGNDIILQFQSQKEQYEKQIEKLATRVEKQSNQRSELAKLVVTLKEEVEQLEYERTQYKE